MCLSGRKKVTVRAAIATTQQMSTAEEMRKQVAALCGLPLLSVGASEWNLFEQHWKETRTGRAYESSK
eukprot:CAMPEP_0198314630 /NCGR_PEP_ID=MMETSP1450-20131203/5196_1 /TAXON_ID=753684 ORGANISM="Madagascaria erythrocladiodes, Strain CCMP3234" /NCGR_SAMPLE_ID=MMETSP1450 /ASSEMBLY_ACC=CAM_ASM_001115 /LENGTH=67 /DNA_ID=CAMNT_0044017693 /DNA_START=1 /DNA_END=204 /DNA_ORIENTATION=-